MTSELLLKQLTAVLDRHNIAIVLDKDAFERRVLAHAAPFLDDAPKWVPGIIVMAVRSALREETIR